MKIKNEKAALKVKEKEEKQNNAARK